MSRGRFRAYLVGKALRTYTKSTGDKVRRLIKILTHNPGPATSGYGTFETSADVRYSAAFGG
jgi:hypothetical protein